MTATEWISRLFFFIVLLSISASMSGSETALFSLSRTQLQKLKNSHPTFYEKLSRLLSSPENLIGTLLIANEIVNVSMGIIVADVYQKILPYKFLGLPDWIAVMLFSIGTTTPIVYIFGEISPKILASRNNVGFISYLVRPLLLFHTIITPIRKIVNFVPKVVLSVTGKVEENHNLNAKLSEQELLALIEEGAKAGSIDDMELKLIQNVFDFDDSTVREILTPISKTLIVPFDMTVFDLINKVKSPYSRIPVFQNSQKNIVGIVYTKDILHYNFKPDEANIPLSHVMKKAMFTHASTKLSVLFKKFKESKTHFAVVVNRGNEALGIVTMDDVLESIFEDALEEEE